MHFINLTIKGHFLKYRSWILYQNPILTISSRRISINAENSNNLNLCVAIARPSHGSWAGGRPASISPDTAVDGLPAGYGCCANGFIL